MKLPASMQSIRFQVLAVALVLLVGLSAALTLNGARVVGASVAENIRTVAEQTSRILNLAIAPYSSAGDFETLRIFLDEMLVQDTSSRGGVQYVVIGSERGHFLVDVGLQGDALPAADDLGHIPEAIRRGVVHVRKPVLLVDNQVGFLQFGLSTGALNEGTLKLSRDGLWLAALWVLVALVFTLIFSLALVRRVEGLTGVAQAIASGDYTRRLTLDDASELGRLAWAFNRMAEAVQERIQALEEREQQIQALNEGLEQRVAERTAELQRVNGELGMTVESLRETRSTLIRAEKLAGLGALVAGVAHELNTPVGNALTVASTFAEKTDAFTQALEAGLRRSVLQQFTEDARTATDLIQRNLGRAAELVTSFKHVAVDQTSSVRRWFDLAEVLRETAATLAPSFKKRPLRLQIDIPSGIRIDSYPGPLGQVLSNLVNNALAHAFAPEQAGTMRLQLEESGREDWLRLRFCDDGAGIPAEIIDRVFDPFFTTRLGQGGSGLGLSIVYNLIKDLIGGQIEVESELGRGTCFVIDLPRVAPRTASESGPAGAEGMARGEPA